MYNHARMAQQGDKCDEEMVTIYARYGSHADPT